MATTTLGIPGIYLRKAVQDIGFGDAGVNAGTVAKVYKIEPQTISFFDPNIPIIFNQILGFENNFWYWIQTIVPDLVITGLTDLSGGGIDGEDGGVILPEEN